MKLWRKKAPAKPEIRPSSKKPAAAAGSVSGAMKNINQYSKELAPEAISQGAHREAVGGMWDEIGQLQFEFLKSRGLAPSHKLCDTGCGALRGGVHFVRYLDAGNYFGLDINTSLIDGGRKELEQAGLTGKNANLLVNDRFEMSLFGAKFDYILAVSVFTHLFGNHIVRCLAEARKVLAPGGQFFATFFEAPTSAHLAPIPQSAGIESRYDSDPFHYSVQEIRMLADLAGLKAEYIGDWRHPRNQRMAAFSLP